VTCSLSPARLSRCLEVLSHCLTTPPGCGGRAPKTHLSVATLGIWSRIFDAWRDVARKTSKCLDLVLNRRAIEARRPRQLATPACSSAITVLVLHDSLGRLTRIDRLHRGSRTTATDAMTPTTQMLLLPGQPDSGSRLAFCRLHRGNDGLRPNRPSCSGTPDRCVGHPSPDGSRPRAAFTRSDFAAGSAKSRCFGVCWLDKSVPGGSCQCTSQSRKPRLAPRHESPCGIDSRFPK
jgi:hypothetical protein